MVRYCIHKLLVPILSQIHPVHTFPSYFPKICSNVIFPHTPKSSKWFLPFRSSDKHFVGISHFSRACYMLRLFHNPDMVTLHYLVKRTSYEASHCTVF